jgi:hypothetical protein
MSRLESAVDWARNELSDGPVPSKVLFRRAREAGISDRTLRRAMKQLGASTRKLSGGRFTAWVWELLLGQVAFYMDKRLPYRNWQWFPYRARCVACEVGITFDRSGLCPRCKRGTA